MSFAALEFLSERPTNFSPDCSTLQSVRNCYLRCHSASARAENGSGRGHCGRRGGPEVTLAPPPSVRRQRFPRRSHAPLRPLSKPDRLGTAQDQGGRHFILKQTNGCRLATVLHREVTVEPAGDGNPVTKLS